jgi:hypothetical protein
MGAHSSSGSETSIDQSVAGVSSVMRWPSGRGAPAGRQHRSGSAIRSSERSIPARTGARAATTGSTSPSAGMMAVGRSSRAARAGSRARGPTAALSSLIARSRPRTASSSPTRAVVAGVVSAAQSAEVKSRATSRMRRCARRGGLEATRGALGIGEELQLRRQVAERQHRRRGAGPARSPSARWPDRRAIAPGAGGGPAPARSLSMGSSGHRKSWRRCPGRRPSDRGDAPKRHVDIALGKPRRARASPGRTS